MPSSAHLGQVKGSVNLKITSVLNQLHTSHFKILLERRFNVVLIFSSAHLGQNFVICFIELVV